MLAAQVVHAAGESSPGGLPPDTHAVVLAARDEAHLAAIEGSLTQAGIAAHSVVENDPPYAGQLMAIGLSPAPKDEVRRPLSNLPLLR